MTAGENSLQLRAAATHLPPSPSPSSLATTRSYNRGTALTYDPGAQTWTGFDIIANACPDPDQPPAPLVPRDSGYTAGIMYDKGQGGGDRLLVLGGDQDENNVYFSDDCGRSWSCYDGENYWDPRSFAPLVHPQGIFPSDPAIVMGGDIMEALPSTAIFLNYGDGTSGQSLFFPPRARP